MNDEEEDSDSGNNSFEHNGEGVPGQPRAPENTDVLVR